MTDGAPAPAPGDVVRAVFPRMAGKARPGVVASARRLEGPGAPRLAVIVAPATTRRTNQPWRIPLAVGVARPSWVLPVMATAFFEPEPKPEPRPKPESGAARNAPIVAEAQPPLPPAVVDRTRLSLTPWRAPPETLAALCAALDVWFGPTWTQIGRPISGGARPALLRPLSGGRRLARARSGVVASPRARAGAAGRDDGGTA